MRLNVTKQVTIVTAVTLGLTTMTSANHSWGSYHWARSTSVLTLQTGDNVDGSWDTYLDQAITDWNTSAVLELVKVRGGARAKNCKPTAGRIEACNSRYGNTGWLGIAQIWASGSHITQAITKLNDTYFDTSTYNTPAWRRLVMCQEIAHDFGLDHQDEEFENANLGSCMDYTNDPDGGAGGAVTNDPSNEHPNSHDYSQLLTIYGHADTSSAAGFEIPESEGGEGPGQWGRLVRSSRNNRVQIYELDLGRGHKKITHVFWADPERDRRGQHDH